MTIATLRGWLAVAGAAAVCFFSGCGGGSPCGVSGKVTFEGKPIPSGAISFVPIEGTVGAGSGAKITDGQYTVPMTPDLQPGKYMVTVSATRPWTAQEKAAIPKPDSDTGVGYDEGEEPPPQPIGEGGKEYIPAKYNANSELRAELSAGENTKDFTL